MTSRRVTYGSQPSIELHIEELVLLGFATGDRNRISNAVERELVSLFTNHGLPPSLLRGSDIVRLDGGMFEVTRGSQAETIGSQVAQSLYGVLNR